MDAEAYKAVTNDVGDQGNNSISICIIEEGATKSNKSRYGNVP